MKILIIGATSAIASSVARRYARRQDEIFLLGRRQQRLQDLEDELLNLDAARVGHMTLELIDSQQHKAAIKQAVEFLGGIDVALICHGSLPDQPACEGNFALTAREIDINGLSVISFLIELAAVLKEQQSGTLAVITSVAGDRGRRPNFVYGAAKALVSAYLQGLRGSLLQHGIHVVDIRPGLVDSPMTAHFKKGLLWSQPDRVARKIVSAIDNRKHTVYAPAYWRLIMALVRSIPDFLFKRLKF